MIEGYSLAFSYIAYQPVVLLFMLGGLFLGLVIGALPGITGPAGIAIMIPFTFVMRPIDAIVMLAALYIGSLFGGAITAILFNTPGSPEAACTSLDGYPLAKKGLAGKALGVAVGVSSLGATLAAVVLALLAPPLANFALRFGPTEYFALAFFGLTVITSIDSKSYWKSLSAGLIGLLLATVGFDPLSSALRNNFGTIALMGGIGFMPIIIGIFAIAEVFTRARHKTLGVVEVDGKATAVSVELPTIKEWLSLKVTFARSFLIGVIIGVLPGIGATTAAFVSYSEEVRWSKNPSLYGTGVMNGVAAPETANSVAATVSMVPLLSLGLPGSAATAVMIGGFLIHGIIPSPLMMVQQKQLVYTIFLTMFLASIVMLFMGIMMTRFFGYALKVRYAILAPIISILCFIGVFSINNSIFDVRLVFFVAVFGYFFRKFDYPLAPLIIGIVLGRIAEENLRRGLSMFNEDLVAMFVVRPITVVLMLLGIASLVYGLYNNFKKMMRVKKEEEAGTAS